MWLNDSWRRMLVLEYEQTLETYLRDILQQSCLIMDSRGAELLQPLVHPVHEEVRLHSLRQSLLDPLGRVLGHLRDALWDAPYSVYPKAWSSKGRRSWELGISYIERVQGDTCAWLKPPVDLVLTVLAASGPLQ